MRQKETRIIKLFEVNDIDIENAQIIYKANLKTENMTDKVYLEMWCVFPGLGEFFSRSLQSLLTGTTDWSVVETPFLLQKGQKPQNKIEHCN